MAKEVKMDNRPALRFDKASIVAFADTDRPTVYRLYRPRTDDHVQMRLVYVGATTNPRRRLLEHLRDDRFEDVTQVELAFYRNTTAMARHERIANVEENPLEKSNGRRHAAWKAQPKRSRGLS
jgi:predicted GIY-YIG superfamily endonuclease